MIPRAALAVWPLLLLLLCAQDSPVLPSPSAPATDPITPVPLPKSSFDSSALFKNGLPKELKIDNQGLVDGSVESGVHLAGPVKIDGDNGMQIFSDTAVLDLKEKSVILEGNVSVYQGNVLQRGRRAVYFYESKFLDSRDLTISMDPILMEAGKFTMQQNGSKQVFIGTDSGITTDDVEEPDFWLRSAETKVFPGDKITFKNLFFYVRNVPVFWLPFLSQPLQGELGYHFIPGSRTNWGPYVLNTYGIMLGGKFNPLTGENEDAWLLSKWHLDLRATRGAGGGVDLSDVRHKDNKNLTGLQLYYLYDLKPQTLNSGVPRDVVAPDRYRVELKHRQPIGPSGDATWHLDTNLTLLSDNYYLGDFEPAHFSNDPQPDNMVGIFRHTDTSLLSLFTRFQINDFQRTATRLPELALDQARGPWFGLPVLHEGSTAMSVLAIQAGGATRQTIMAPLLAMPVGDSRETALLNQLPEYERLLIQRIRGLPPGDARIATLTDQLFNIGYTRFNTCQEFSLPLNVSDGFSLTPQAGLGYTRYMALAGPDTAAERTYLHAGVEAAVKFSKNLGVFRYHDWGLDGLLHVIQPYVNWSVLSTNDLDPSYPQVDRLTASTLPPTLAVTRFTATDALSNWNILRLGTRNRLLTQRDGQAYEWMYLNTYIDGYITDPLLNRTVSNLYNDFRFNPVPWLGLGLQSQFPVYTSGSGFNEFSTYMRYLPMPDLEFTLGYRWLKDNPALPNSNHIDLHTYARLNENWGVGMHQSIEMDDNTIELQQYTLHRDLGNWVAGVGLTRRDNRIQRLYGLIFSITLKEFPSVSLPFSIDY
ncbi:MAG: LPS assembly protein LptD [Verrucomicrobiota bacterium]